MLKKNDAVHAVLAVYDPKGDYSRHAGVVMTSIFEHTKSSVCVHILHDQTLTERNRSLLFETAELFNQRVEFHDVSSRVERVGDEALQLARRSYSVGSLFRLLIPDVLPLDRVIYLDSDVIVNMDIRELREIPMEGCSLAGVPDLPHRRFSANSLRLALMGCDREGYISSGVLLMNPDQIRKRYNLLQRSVSWFQRYRHCVRYPDQDFLNSCFRGDIKLIDGKFNHIGHDAAEAILHPSSSPKPWSGLRGSEVDRIYWKTFFRTPWGRCAPEEIVDILIGAVKDSTFTHRHTSQCYRKIWFRLSRDVLHNDVAECLALCAKELRYRISSRCRGRGDFVP
jgi:lipopolysaccharide biosynthesis glycosyltransferase